MPRYRRDDVCKSSYDGLERYSPNPKDAVTAVPSTNPPNPTYFVLEKKNHSELDSQGVPSLSSSGLPGPREMDVKEASKSEELLSPR